MTTNEKKTHPVCRYCGSDNVAADAAVRYDKESNDWELASTFDGGHCDDCGEDMKYFNWVETTCTSANAPLESTWKVEFDPDGGYDCMSTAYKVSNKESGEIIMVDGKDFGWVHSYHRPPPGAQKRMEAVADAIAQALNQLDAS